MKRQKRAFLTLFSILAVLLMLMPLIATFNDFLTRVVMSFEGYKIIREYIVPLEVRLVALFLRFFGFSTSVTEEYVVIGGTTGKALLLVEIVWNCIGWQSLLFFLGFCLSRV